MANDKEFKTSIPVPPGDTLKEHLEDIQMSQLELSKRTGLTPKHINEIIHGKASISQDTSLKLENVLGIPASFWNNLESIFQETLARIEAEQKIDEEIEIAKVIPYAEIAKKNWIQHTLNVKEKVINLRNYFGVASLNLISDTIPVAFRKSEIRDSSSLALATWLRRGEILSQKIETEPFNKEKLKSFIPEFRELTLTSPNVFCKKIQEICATCGVAVVFVPHIKGTYANGATKWLNPSKAMIELSLRGSYADIFWFSFFHELGHVFLHSKKETFVVKSAEDLKQVWEEEADIFASNTLIPPRDYETFISKNIINELSITQFASKLNIHRGIVVGRLQHDKLIGYHNFSNLRIRYQWK